ncbi:hypothetical protein [Limnohabitans sp. Rim8]|uniref:hypothetical protein n=1 Tax=Limnohabitans sp. Rim8 TaxID=1100718 RepID=UPI00330578D6
MPIESAIANLHKAHTDAQDKYTYFLLAAAGAAIAFAVQKTEGMSLSWWLTPVALATAAWAGSFFFGCKNLSWVGAALSANYALLQLRQGSHPKQPPHPQLLEAAINGTTTALEGNVLQAQRFALWQFRLLVIGAALLIAWRVLEMWRITK